MWQNNVLVQPLAVGTPVTWGDAHIKNPTEEPAYIDSITVEATNAQFVRQVLVSQYHRRANGQLAFWHAIADGQYPAWPPDGTQAGDLVQPSKAVIPPRRWVNIVSELATPAYGRFVAGPIVIEYHIGNQHYQTTLDARATVCGVHQSQVGKVGPSESAASPR